MRRCSSGCRRRSASSVQSPIPESSITCGLEEALSTIETVPDFGPCVFGEKATLILQLAPAATLLRQVEVMANWPATFMEEMFSAVLPVFVSVTLCGALVLPAACFLKFSGLMGENLTTPVLSRIMTELPE